MLILWEAICRVTFPFENFLVTAIFRTLWSFFNLSCFLLFLLLTEGCLFHKLHFSLLLDDLSSPGRLAVSLIAWWSMLWDVIVVRVRMGTTSTAWRSWFNLIQDLVKGILLSLRLPLGLQCSNLIFGWLSSLRVRIESVRVRFDVTTIVWGRFGRVKITDLRVLWCKGPIKAINMLVLDALVAVRELFDCLDSVLHVGQKACWWHVEDLTLLLQFAVQVLLAFDEHAWLLMALEHVIEVVEALYESLFHLFSVLVDHRDWKHTQVRSKVWLDKLLTVALDWLW